MDFTRKERVIFETALKLMFAGGYEAASTRTVSESLMIEADRLGAPFASDDALRLSAMRYAACVWVEQVKSELDTLPASRDKLKRLVKLFAAGSESHAHSLSLYVDAWKALKESDAQARQCMADSLAAIYQIYVDLFRDVVFHMTGGGRDLAAASVIGWILVVISDGFFVQSLIQPEPLDFNLIGDTLYQMVESLVFKNGDD